MNKINKFLFIYFQMLNPNHPIVVNTNSHSLGFGIVAFIAIQLPHVKFYSQTFQEKVFVNYTVVIVF